MKVLLFLVALASVMLVAQSTRSLVPCDNPFIRHIEDSHDWAFSYLADAAFQALDNKICPGFAGTNSCCDGGVYDALAVGWVKLYAEVVAVRVQLDVLQLEVDVLQIEIADVKQAVQAHGTELGLTTDEVTAIVNFLDAISAAVGNLVPDVVANFVSCYSAILRFYVGLLCKTCDVTWSDWVILLGNDTATDAWKLKFAQSTCDTLSSACLPFFTPFYNYRNALLTAVVDFELAVANNLTRDLILARIKSYEAVCNNASDCLEFICYRFLSGFDRLEDWIWDSFQNATDSSPLGSRQAFVTDRFVNALNRFHHASHKIHKTIARSSDGLSGTEYGGTFDPTKQSSSLNTNANSNSGATALRSMLMNLF